ncbi:MAG: hypothetical protein WDW36_001450 [Sanguina aurantia]
MEPGGEVGLSELFRRVPALLEACSGNKDRDEALLKLRLLNREASQVALRALKTYYLDLRGEFSDSIVAGATLLQATRLHTFKVYLQLSATFNPVRQLLMFLSQVGAALSSVNTMDLHLEDDGTSNQRSAQLSDAMVAMAAACPTLKIFFFPGTPVQRLSSAAGAGLPSALMYVHPCGARRSSVHAEDCSAAAFPDPTAP